MKKSLLLILLLLVGCSVPQTKWYHPFRDGKTDSEYCRVKSEGNFLKFSSCMNSLGWNAVRGEMVDYCEKINNEAVAKNNEIIKRYGSDLDMKAVFPSERHDDWMRALNLTKENSIKTVAANSQCYSPVTLVQLRKSDEEDKRNWGEAWKNRAQLNKLGITYENLVTNFRQGKTVQDLIAKRKR